MTTLTPADSGFLAAALDDEARDQVERLRAAVDALLDVARDVVSDGEGTLNPGLLALAQTAIAQAEQAHPSTAPVVRPPPEHGRPDP